MTSDGPAYPAAPGPGPQPPHTTDPRPLHGQRHRRNRRTPLGVAVEAVVIVLAFAAAGLGGTFVWMALWEPPQGQVVDGIWYAVSFPDVGREFSAIGWYVVIGLAGGVLLGLLAALFASRSEIVTLGAVALGSAIAAGVMHRVGTMLAPPDPTTVAAGPDGLVDGTLVMAGDSWFVAWPLGAIVAVFVVYLLTTGVDAGVAEARRVDRSRGLSGSPTG